MRTIIWFIYFWGYLLCKKGTMKQGLRALEAGDWATADAIRAQLTELGWAVKDTAQGPQLSKI